MADRPSIEEMAEDFGEDRTDNLRPYLAVAMIPLELQINEAEHPTQESKLYLVKTFLEAMGFAGADVKSVEPIPGARH